MCLLERKSKRDSKKTWIQAGWMVVCWRSVEGRSIIGHWWQENRTCECMYARCCMTETQCINNFVILSNDDTIKIFILKMIWKKKIICSDYHSGADQKSIDWLAFYVDIWNLYQVTYYVWVQFNLKESTLEQIFSFLLKI